ncbi:suppressor of clathrin deficiency [Tyrophagus putrescentiae]|nr:suppressor of clathrin deficiency [Tyrophagus putrescentiae]
MTNMQIEIVWRNVLLMAALHLLALRGLLLYSKITFCTFLFTVLLFKATALGVQLGAHRLWAHRSFRATAPLRLFLALCHVLALQNDLYEWCRDHRAHHAYSETDADPHDSRRGFFFSHMGWLLVRKHPEVANRGKLISLADLTADPVVAFQRRWYRPLVFLLWFAFPVAVPVWGWGERVEHALLFCVFFRGRTVATGQSAPAEATLLVRHLVGGEAFHNYHHTFPWDAGASELGPGEVFNPASAYLNCFPLAGAGQRAEEG